MEAEITLAKAIHWSGAEKVMARLACELVARDIQVETLGSEMSALRAELLRLQEIKRGHESELLEVGKRNSALGQQLVEAHAQIASLLQAVDLWKSQLTTLSDRRFVLYGLLEDKNPIWKTRTISSKVIRDLLLVIMDTGATPQAVSDAKTQFLRLAAAKKPRGRKSRKS